MTISTIWWFVSRSTGLVAAMMLALSVLWGIFLSTKLLQDRKRPAWLLDLHRWLGWLTVAFTVAHLAALAADSYLEFDLRSFLVPFASSWRPIAVTWGVGALYVLAAVQISSLLRRRLSRRVWHGVHLLSYGLVWVVAIHAALAGSDVTNPVYRAGLVLVVAWLAFAVLYRVLGPRRNRSARRRGPVAAKA